MPERKVLFVRHGESEANVKDVFAGQRDDCFLTELGRDQARMAADELLALGVKINRIICSPLMRAKETAHIIVWRMGITSAEIVYDPRLLEYDMGELSGKPREKITSRELVSSEGAEDPYSFCDRVEESFQEAINNVDTILIVGHGGVFRGHRARELGIDPMDFYDLPLTPNAKIEEVAVD